MPNSPDLDSVFSALSNPTRRDVIEALRSGPLSVGALAEPFDMALPSFMQHIRLLEEAGLVRTRKEGRTRMVESRREPMLHLERWLDAERASWERRLDQLDDFLLRNTSPRDTDS